MIHVYPLNDLKPHDTENGTDCWCKPQEDEGVIIHNSMDGREDYATGHAMHPLEKKGMDASQITGAASSYARKYALNGLFCIDDTKDADTDEHKKQQEKPKDLKDPKRELYAKIQKQLKEANNIDTLDYVWHGFADDIESLPDAGQKGLAGAYESKKAELVAASGEMEN